MNQNRNGILCIQERAQTTTNIPKNNAKPYFCQIIMFLLSKLFRHVNLQLTVPLTAIKQRGVAFLCQIHEHRYRLLRCQMLYRKISLSLRGGTKFPPMQPGSPILALAPKGEFSKCNLPGKIFLSPPSHSYF